MFQSVPICILTAGPTVDGRNIAQKIIDDIAETYSPDTYTARINEDHFKWSSKFGSVLSVEKRDDQLWAVIKPNSWLLRSIENGQLLHTSCEYVEDFAGTGKAYLTGLALTDEPASLGTSQIHLSAEQGKVPAIHANTGNTVQAKDLLVDLPEPDSSAELNFFQRFKSWLGRHGETELTQLSQTSEQQPEKETQQVEKEMSKEIEVLLTQSIEQNQKLCGQLEQLTQTLSTQGAGQETAEPEPETTELEQQVAKLSSQMDDMLTKLSQTTDESYRQPAGMDADIGSYL